jgi:flagellar hook-basal body complex protein FliE
MTDFGAIGSLANLINADIEHKNACKQFEDINSSAKSFLDFAAKSLSSADQISKGNFKISSIVSPLKDKLSKFDQIAQGAVIGKFSMLEAASALKEAKLCLELMTEVRKQIVSGLNQILNSNSG